MEKEMKSIDRREFINKSAKLAVGVSAFSLFPNRSLAGNETDKKLKVVLVGTGSRGTGTWGKSLVGPYKDYIELVGLCDINPKRVEYAKKYIGTNAPTYLAKDFDRMVQETKPDAVIITTVDCFHAKYAVRAMELGCNVISEKPLATEAEQCQELLDTELKTGRKIITTFNVRHHLFAEEIKQVVMSGDLGKIISAEFQEYLDIVKDPSA